MITGVTRALGLLLLLAGAGCFGPADEALVIRIDTDFDVPSEVNIVGFDVTEADGTPGGGSGLVVSDRRGGAEAGCNESFLPRLELLSRPAGDRITLDFTAELVELGTSNRMTRVEQRVVIEVIEDRWIVVPIRLDRACEGVVCGADETCRDGTCVSPVIDGAGLPDFDRAREDEIICDC